MSRLPDAPERRDRAVSAVVGFVLIFGILVITFSLYQAQVVPQQNSQVEFEQHQEIQQQMVELRSNIVSMQGSTSTLSTAFDLGVRYPSRTIFVNPGPASGSLRTKGASDPDVNVTLRNVTATDSENDETADFWDGTKLNYSTSIIEYEPDFNRFQGGLPVVYEHSLIYNRVENGDSVPITDQSLINGNRINLIALNGTLAESGVGAESVDLEPVSTRTRVVEVNNKSGPITLEFASLLNASVWNETLEDQQYVESVKFNRSISTEFSILELKLEPNRDYELKLSKVGLGTGATNTDAEYLTEVEGAGATVLNDSTQKLTVEARDRFNGPQSGVTVNASAEGGTVNDNRTTDSEGQATFIYDPERDSGNYNINFTIDSEYDPDDSHDPSTATNVSINVTVTSNTDGSGGFSVDWKEDELNSSAVTDKEGEKYPYKYNASETGTLVLNMSTDPSVDEAQVNYAVTNRSQATLSTYSGQTDANGNDSTTLQPKENGTITVYTYSGGDADELQIEITNVTGGDGTLVYQNDSDDLSLIEGNDSEPNPTGQTNLKVIGQPGTGLSSGDTLKIPYVDNSGNLKLTDINGGTTTLVAQNNNDKPSPRQQKKSTMATGTWNGSNESVFYAGRSNNQDVLYRVNASGTPKEIKTLDSNGIKGVVDIGDIDSDGDDELIYIGGSAQLRYIDDDGTAKVFKNGDNLGSNNVFGAGEVVEFNGTEQVLYVDGNNDLNLAVANDRNNERFDVNNATKTQPAAADVDGDGETEFVYIDSGDLRYVDDVEDSFRVKPLKDTDENLLTANKKRGVVSEG